MRVRSCRVLLTAVGAIVCLASGCTSHSAGPGARTPVGGGPVDDGLSPSDSVEILSSAKRAVRQYRRRILNAPVKTPEFRRRLSEDERPGVISLLDEHSRALPGDDWIVGHRVGMRIKHGLMGEAHDVASACRASLWWCEALRGFTSHLLGRFVAAERAFTTALGAMPEGVRCGWWGNRLADILQGELQERYREADCRERSELEERVWWLADPLHMKAGNDRRTEHLSRLVGLRLADQLQALVQVPPTRRHHAAILRRGWPWWWWSSYNPRPWTGGLASRPNPYPDGVPEHPGYRFVPPSHAVLEPLTPSGQAWPLHPGHADEERYDPPYGPFFHLEGQTAFFRRDDSVVAVMGTHLEEHPLAGSTARFGRDRPSVDLAVVLTRGPDGDPVMVRREAPPSGTHRFRLLVPHDAYIVSVEAVSGERGAARTRFGHRLPASPPNAVGTSDVLLFQWEEDLDKKLAAAWPRMLGTTRLTAGDAVGIYWEVYGLPPDEQRSLDMSLRLRSRDRGLLGRIGEALGLVGPPGPWLWAGGSLRIRRMTSIGA